MLKWIRNLALLAYAAFALFPLLWMLIISFKHDRERTIRSSSFRRPWRTIGCCLRRAITSDTS